MGLLFSQYRSPCFCGCLMQQTYKYCETCDDIYGTLNRDLLVLDIYREGCIPDDWTILMRCSKGHKIYYFAGSKHRTSVCIKQIEEASSYYVNCEATQLLSESFIVTPVQEPSAPPQTVDKFS